MGLWKSELWGHDADHSGRHAVDVEGLADGIGPRLKARLPDAMTDDDDGRRPRLRIGLGKVPAENGRHAQGTEQSRRDTQAAQALWVSARTSHGHPDVVVALERFERGLLAAPVREVVIRDVFAPAASRVGCENRQV